MKQTTELTSYDQQAKDFMVATKTGLAITFKKHGLYFPTDKNSRDIFKITITTPKGQYTFTFGQSQNKSTRNGGHPPTAYDILACFTKYDPGTFENFCGDFGYDTHSRTDERIYKAVCKEWRALSRLYTPEQLELMQEIQ
jgi:hypothetical protein